MGEVCDERAVDGFSYTNLAAYGEQTLLFLSFNVHKSAAAAVSCRSTEGADGPSWHSRSRQKYATLMAEYVDEHTAEFCSLYVEIFVFGAV